SYIVDQGPLISDHERSRSLTRMFFCPSSPSAPCVCTQGVWYPSPPSEARSTPSPTRCSPYLSKCSWAKENRLRPPGEPPCHGASMTRARMHFATRTDSNEPSGKGRP